MFGPFKPAPHIAELPADKIDSTYKRLRWQVFAGIFFGYAAYYFVRANFDLAQPGLIQQGLYTKAQLGVIGSAAGLAYGLSKFVMAGMSDRSNPRVFFTIGLLLSGLCMTMMGLFPWATSGHCHHVGNDLLKWLVPRYGLASMWSYKSVRLVV